MGITLHSVADLFAHGWDRHQTGDFADAERAYREVLRADPAHSEAHHLLGVIAYQQERYEAAVASIRRALALDPGNASYHSNLGLAHEALEHGEEAARCFREALRLHPQFSQAHLNLGITLLRQGAL